MNEQLVQEALGHWEITDPEPQLVAQRENLVYKVRRADGSAAALRIHRPGYRNAAELRSELLWLLYLSRARLPVPRPVPDKDGELMVSVGTEPRQAVNEHIGALLRQVFGHLE